MSNFLISYYTKNYNMDQFVHHIKFDIHLFKKKVTEMSFNINVTQILLYIYSV